MGVHRDRRAGLGVRPADGPQHPLDAGRQALVVDRALQERRLDAGVRDPGRRCPATNSVVIGSSAVLARAAELEVQRHLVVGVQARRDDDVELGSVGDPPDPVNIAAEPQRRWGRRSSGSRGAARAVSLVIASSTRSSSFQPGRVVLPDFLVENEDVLVHERQAQRIGVDWASDSLDLCHGSTVAWSPYRPVGSIVPDSSGPQEVADGIRISTRAPRSSAASSRPSSTSSILPAEPVFEEQAAKLAGEGRGWERPPIMDDLKAKARKRGLWNLFLARHPEGAGLTNLQYAPLAELSGRSFLTPEALNCAAPDTGNMEVLAEFGTEEQQERWLRPLLDGEIRSAFCMTEPDVASSDATNISTSIVRDGDVYVINGRKWWSSGAMDPRCQILIVMGKTNPDADRHRQQSQILVPRDTPGVDIQRGMNVFGYTDGTHGGHAEVVFTDVRVPVANVISGEGEGLRDRAGPSRAWPDPPLHAADRRGRAGAGADVPPGHSSGSRGASRWPSRASSRTGSPRRGCRSRPPGCSCSRLPG